jgi:hypothetical protein
LWRRWSSASRSLVELLGSSVRLWLGVAIGFLVIIMGLLVVSALLLVRLLLRVAVVFSTSELEAVIFVSLFLSLEAHQLRIVLFIGLAKVLADLNQEA